MFLQSRRLQADNFGSNAYGWDRAHGSATQQSSSTTMPTSQGLFSPPSSGSSSPTSLSVITTSSATSYSNAGGAGDHHTVSPLPSPGEYKGADIPVPGGSKTNAFFSSPFSSTGPPTPAPPPAPTRSTTLSTETIRSESAGRDIGMDQSSDENREHVKPKSRSATSDFFWSSTASPPRLTPAPSLKSTNPSRESSPPRLPPLSRFFPSRYSSDRRNDYEEPAVAVSDSSMAAGTSVGSNSSAEWETSFKREFLNLSTKINKEHGSGISAEGKGKGGSWNGLHLSELSMSPVDDLRDEELTFSAIQKEPGEVAGSSLLSPPLSLKNLPSASTSPMPVVASLPPETMPTPVTATAPKNPFPLTVPSSSSHVNHHHPYHKPPIRRETRIVTPAAASRPSSIPSSNLAPPSTSTSAPHAGQVLAGDSSSFSVTLIRALGQGAFSSVWLARCVGNVGVMDQSGRRRKSESWARKSVDKAIGGFVPVKSQHAVVPDGTTPESNADGKARTDHRDASIMLDEHAGEGASGGVFEGLQKHDSQDGDVVVNSPDEERLGRLVAVKMMTRALCDANDRTRISFVREVEVLRHISHPNIVAYLHSFTTHSHHCLVLDHIDGGELFEMINSDKQYAKLTMPILRRIWGELCRAIGWMHGVALVHRDIKLENILLTTNIFNTDPESLPAPNVPLIKLTDFGLSRFIDPSNPHLSTRCGSEAYAAPELVVGGTTRERGYDARQTDAWACGVVLYALATRKLPFDPPSQFDYVVMSSATGDLSRAVSRASVGTLGGLSRKTSASSAYATAKRRREMLMRIAQCEYSWPESHEDHADDELDGRIRMPILSTDQGLRNVVERLLVRDASKRARLIELWDEEWMKGEGAPAPPLSFLKNKETTVHANGSTAMEGSDSHVSGFNGLGDKMDLEEQSYDEGHLVDGESIDNVARQDLDPEPEPRRG